MHRVRGRAETFFSGFLFHHTDYSLFSLIRMCGIAAIVGGAFEHVAVERMLDSIPWRGPDSRGVWRSEEAMLGHLRLSIIDTSEAGYQPLWSHDGRYVVVFNGEIFNYIELRQELQAAGAVFRTTGDTEVILEAYRHWGKQCVSHFNGMWAFALWDTGEKSLFASRDRFGIKPLYYRMQGKTLLLASEMKALLVESKSAMDKSYLFAFFNRKTSLGDDRTVLADIRHLQPGHSLLWQNRNITIERYWESNPQAFRQRYSYEDPVATFRELLTDSVRLRLRSDVPVGISLSGGVDSSVIAMLTASVTPHTFSTVYQEDGYSEEQYIDAVNQAIGVEGKKITPRSADFFGAMEQIVAHHDEPVRMPGVFSHWQVMNCAHNSVTVIVDGQGADEIVGGYTELFPAYFASLARDMLSLRQPLEAWRQASAFRQSPRGPKVNYTEAFLQAMPQSLRALLRRSSLKTQLFRHVQCLQRK